MIIERRGFIEEIAKDNEGVIYQANFPTLGEMIFSYFRKDYTDPNKCYADCKYTVARFTVKSKIPLV